MELRQIAALIGGEVSGDRKRRVSRAIVHGPGGPEDLILALLPDPTPSSQGPGAPALLVPREELGNLCGRDAVVCDKPRDALALCQRHLESERVWNGSEGIHPTAHVAPTAMVEPTAAVGPGCIVGPGALIAAWVRLLPGAIVGADCSIGRASIIGAHAVVQNSSIVGCRCEIGAGAAIGSPGQDYRPAPGRWERLPSCYKTQIEDEVHVGANAVVEAGIVRSTVVKRGAVVHALVYVSHDCVVGEGAILSGFTGLAGGVEIGDGAVLYGKVGIASKLTIGQRAIVGAGSMVMRDVPDGGNVFGYPARPRSEALRVMAASETIIRLRERVAILEKMLGVTSRRDDTQLMDRTESTIHD